MPRVMMPVDERLPTNLCAGCCGDQNITEAAVEWRKPYPPLLFSDTDYQRRSFKVWFGVCRECRPTLEKPAPNIVVEALGVGFLSWIASLTILGFFLGDAPSRWLLAAIPLVASVIAARALFVWRRSQVRRMSGLVPVKISESWHGGCFVDLTNERYAKIAKAASGVKRARSDRRR